MKTHSRLATAALLLMMACTQAAFALGGEYGKGDPKHPIDNSTWPTGITVMANRADRVGGYWVNSMDTFIYQGDAKAFNSFLQQYASVQGSRTLILYAGNKYDLFALQPRDGSRQDWELDAGWGGATVSLSLDGRIRLRDLHVPRNITVEFEGTRTREVDAFLARHQSRPH